LTKQLKELESINIVHKTIFPEVPPRVEYSLTDFGRQLQPVLKGMYKAGILLENNTPEHD